MNLKKIRLYHFILEAHTQTEVVLNVINIFLSYNLAFTCPNSTNLTMAVEMYIYLFIYLCLVFSGLFGHFQISEESQRNYNSCPGLNFVCEYKRIQTLKLHNFIGDFPSCRNYVNVLLIPIALNEDNDRKKKLLKDRMKHLMKEFHILSVDTYLPSNQRLNNHFSSFYSSLSLFLRFHPQFVSKITYTLVSPRTVIIHALRSAHRNLCVCFCVCRN